jgi:hypothetical protein
MCIVFLVTCYYYVDHAQGATAFNPDEAQQNLTTKLCSQQKDSNKNVPAQRKVVIHDDLGLKLAEKKEALQKNVDYNNITFSDLVSQGYRTFKR